MSLNSFAGKATTTSLGLAANPPPPRNAPRIASLDWARGWMLIASVAVNSLLFTPAWFNHAPWDGVHPLDVIFPIFVTLSGCGLAFAMARKVQVVPLLRRMTVLLILGLVYNSIVEWSVDIATWRVTGVLQLYAILIAVVGLLHLVTKTWRGWAAITVIFAFAHTTVVTGFAANCAASILTRECNPSGPLDYMLFGAHMYAGGAAGHDPEGIVAVFGSLVSASAGATVGHLMLATRRRAIRDGRGPATATVPLLIAATGMLLIGVLTLTTIPILLGAQLQIMKRLWTAPFALIIAAGTTVALLIGHILLDRVSTSKAVKITAYPLLALGRNSLLVYFGSHILTSLLGHSAQDGVPLAEHLADFLTIVGPPQVTWTLLLLSFWIGLASLLHRHRIYLRP